MSRLCRMYNEAVRLRLSYAEAQYKMAVSLAALWRVAEAIESCRATLRTRPDLKEARKLLDSLRQTQARRVRLAHGHAPPYGIDVLLKESMGRNATRYLATAECVSPATEQQDHDEDDEQSVGVQNVRSCMGWIALRRPSMRCGRPHMLAGWDQVRLSYCEHVAPRPRVIICAGSIRKPIRRACILNDGTFDGSVSSRTTEQPPRVNEE